MILLFIVLQDYQNKQQYDPRDPLLIHLHDSHSIRRYIYEYIRNHYPLLVAKPGDSVDTYSISLDTSLLPLLSYHITRDDLTLLYHYLHKGPQHINASTGICIGCNLTRLDRTEVYRYLSSTYRNLESKTVDLRNQVINSFFFLVILYPSHP